MNKLAEQREALGRYIDDLLTDAVEPVIAAMPQAARTELLEEKSRHDDGAKLNFMLLQVKDLKLAVRADSVKSVLPWPTAGVDCEEGIPVALETAGRHGGRTPVVDLRRLVFPEGHAGRADCSPYRYLVLLRELPVALACDDIGEVVCAEPQDVQWRDTRTTRPWLAGMLRRWQCAVIDLAGIDARH